MAFFDRLIGSKGECVRLAAFLDARVLLNKIGGKKGRLGSFGN